MFCGIFTAIGQNVLVHHPLYPFSKYNSDTVAYLTRNFDGGADDYFYEQPLSKFFEAIDPAMPIRTFYPHYVAFSKVRAIPAFFCFPYTKEELKRLVKEGKPIYAIGLAFSKSLSDNVEPELYNYIRSLGLGKILSWTPEVQQKIGHLIFDQGSYQEVTSDVKRYLEYHP